MIHVSRTPEFSNCGNMSLISDTFFDQDLEHTARGRTRLRSHSYYNAEDDKNYGGHILKEKTCLRPRSRSFYSYETSELYSEDDFEHFATSIILRQMPSSLAKYEVTKKEERRGDGSGVQVTTRSKLKPNKQSTSGATCDSKENLKSVCMMTISEADNWEICSSSGMKYGQFVDWEKIDPEAAKRYQQILQSEHQQLKRMGREGFWATTHTLRAKAYYQIIHSINSRTPDRDVYYELAKKLFGEQKISTHPVPECMAGGEIPSEDEAECFCSVSRLICYNDPNKRYIDQTFLTYRASCMTFGDLANKCCRGVRKLIASSHQNLFEFYSDWIMWIFADLPFTYAIRVLDVYLLEGYKVLYRVALALLDLYKVSVSSRVSDVEDFRTDMKSFVQNVARHCTAEKLLERAFMIPMATRRELNLLFNANKDSLIQRGVSIHQRRTAVETVDFSNFRSSVVTGTEMRVIWAWIPERFALFSPFRLFSIAEHERSLASFYSHVEGHEPAVLIIKTMDEEVFGAFLSTDLIERRKHDSEKLSYFGTGECSVFTLRPSMELYQRAMINIMTRRAPPEQIRDSISASAQVSANCNIPYSATLAFPADTTQNSSYLTVPFTAPLEEPMSAKEPKWPKERAAFMYITGNDNQLIIGGDGGHALCLQKDLHRGYTEPCDTFKSIPLCKRNFKIQSLEVWGIQNSVSFPQCFPSQ